QAERHNADAIALIRLDRAHIHRVRSRLNREHGFRMPASGQTAFLADSKQRGNVGTVQIGVENANLLATRLERRRQIDGCRRLTHTALRAAHHQHEASIQTRTWKRILHRNTPEFHVTITRFESDCYSRLEYSAGAKNTMMTKSSVMLWKRCSTSAATKTTLPALTGRSSSPTWIIPRPLTT